MSIRQFIAILLLLNYLLVVGAGCVNRPEDPRERVLVRTVEEGHHYQQCRYLRMDGLDEFLAEAMATHYEKSAKSTQQYLFFVINGVDAHHLPVVNSWSLPVPAHRMPIPRVADITAMVTGVDRVLYTPPRLG